MNQHEDLLLYFGPIAVLIEWLGIVIGSHYAHGFTINDALSRAGISPQPLPIIFGLTLTFAGLCYFVFLLRFLKYTPIVPVLGALGGLAFALTGWIRMPLVPLQGWNGKVHLLTITTAVLSYMAVVWFMKNYELPAVQRASQFIFWLMLLTIALTTASIFVFHRYLALMQLAILLLLQSWTIYVGWHIRRQKFAEI